jgi:hypothetical protein
MPRRRAPKKHSARGQGLRCRVLHCISCAFYTSIGLGGMHDFTRRPCPYAECFPGALRWGIRASLSWMDLACFGPGFSEQSRNLSRWRRDEV